MSRKFFSGATLEQAVLAAARHYELEPDRIAYSQRDKKHGFLTVRRKFVIEVDPRSPERPEGEEVPWEPKLAGRPSRGPAATAAPAAPQVAKAPTRAPKQEATAPEPREEDVDRSAEAPVPDEAAPAEVPALRLDRNRDEAPAPQAAPPAPERKLRPEPVTDDALEAADLALGDVADFLYYDMHWDIRLDDDEVVRIELGGEDSHKIVEEDGRLLRSIEHLMPRLIRSKLGRGVSCTVDCEGFKEAHELHLESLAKRAADEVEESQRSKLLEPMTPADRRVVHVALADHPAVETESEGRGFKKRVRIVALDAAEDTY